MLTRTMPLRAASAVAALVLVAACGGAGESDGPAIKQTTAAPTASASASSPGGEPAPDTRPKDDRSDAGAIAFSAFAVQSIVATTGGAPLDDFLEMAIDTCDGCIALAKEVGDDPAEVQRFEGQPTISGAEVAKKDGDDVVVDQSVAVPAGQKVKTADSSVVSEIAPATYRWVVRATWKDDRWFVADYSVEKTS